jgi:hypothetical protein
LATFFHGTNTVLILAKYGLGYILGDFFTNSSGHPEQEAAGGTKDVFYKRVASAKKLIQGSFCIKVSETFY